MTQEATVYVVDDEPSVRKTLGALLGSVGLDVETYSSAEGFLEAFDPDRPGCLVLDVRLQGMSGLELQEKFSREGVDIPIIVVTAHGDVPTAVRAFEGGAVGFVEKPYNPQLMLERVRQAVNRDVQARQGLAQLDEIQRRSSLLTPREREVMTLVAAGHANKVIATKLHMSQKTVETHRGRVMKKMQADSVAELVRMVIALERRQDNP